MAKNTTNAKLEYFLNKCIYILYEIDQSLIDDNKDHALNLVHKLIEEIKLDMNWVKGN
jgi:hypothetical protein